jgi:hypothetical protein
MEKQDLNALKEMMNQKITLKRIAAIAIKRK